MIIIINLKIFVITYQWVKIYWAMMMSLIVTNWPAFDPILTWWIEKYSCKNIVCCLFMSSAYILLENIYVGFNSFKIPTSTGNEKLIDYVPSVIQIYWNLLKQFILEFNICYALKITSHLQSLVINALCFGAMY